MSGEIDVSPGFVFDELTGEKVSLVKLNKLVRDLVLAVAAGAITARELADGSISADKLDSDVAVQLGNVADGSITTGKMANLAVTTEKLADDAVTAAKLADDAVLQKVRLQWAVGLLQITYSTTGTKGLIGPYPSIEVTAGDVIVAEGSYNLLGAGRLSVQLQESTSVASRIVQEQTGYEGNAGNVKHREYWEADSTGTLTMYTQFTIYAAPVTLATRSLTLRRLGNPRDT